MSWLPSMSLTTSDLPAVHADKLCPFSFQTPNKLKVILSPACSKPIFNPMRVSMFKNKNWKHAEHTTNARGGCGHSNSHFYLWQMDLWLGKDVKTTHSSQHLVDIFSVPDASLSFTSINSFSPHNSTEALFQMRKLSHKGVNRLSQDIAPSWQSL